MVCPKGLEEAEDELVTGGGHLNNSLMLQSQALHEAVSNHPPVPGSTGCCRLLFHCSVCDTVGLQSSTQQPDLSLEFHWSSVSDGLWLSSVSESPKDYGFALFLTFRLILTSVLFPYTRMWALIVWQSWRSSKKMEFFVRWSNLLIFQLSAFT